MNAVSVTHRQALCGARDTIIHKQFVVLLLSVGIGCGGTIGGDPGANEEATGGMGGEERFIDEASGGSAAQTEGTPTLDVTPAKSDAAPSIDAVGSNDGGVVADTSAPNDEPPAGWVPAVVGVGYAGIRALSKDLGRTWPIHPALQAGPGNDDGDLLRGIAYGKGLWLTGGWQHFISKDGVNWTKAALPKGCGLMEGVAYGQGIFVMTCGDGDTFLSNDGRTWRNGKQGVGTGRHITVVFGLINGVGKFAVSGDSGASYTSTDGVTWSSLPGIRHARYCAGVFRNADQCPGFFGHNVWVRTASNLNIERSVDGRTWSKGAAFPSFVGWYAFGYAPP